MNIPNYITTPHWACVKHQITSQHHIGRVWNIKLLHNTTLGVCETPNYFTTPHWACVKHQITSQHHIGRVWNTKLLHNTTLGVCEMLWSKYSFSITVPQSSLSLPLSSLHTSNSAGIQPSGIFLNLSWLYLYDRLPSIVFKIYLSPSKISAIINGSLYLGSNFVWLLSFTGKFQSHRFFNQRTLCSRIKIKWKRLTQMS